MQIKYLLNGKELNLTGDNIKIKSNNFNVDEEGNLICKNATVEGTIDSINGTIGGWTINNEGFTNGTVFINSDGSTTVYTVADLIIIRNYIMNLEGFELSDAMIRHYDFNGDGQITAADYVRLQNKIGIRMED